MPDKLNGIIISEVLADNPDVAGSLDVNNSGNADKQDEFVEFQNTTNADIDISGYRVFSLENGLLHTFDAGTTIEAGETVVVVGTFDPMLSANAGLDNFVQANGNNDGASSNGGFLEDGEGQKNDTLYLVDPQGNYIQLSYGQNLNVPDPGEFPIGFPSNPTLQGTGETIASSAPNTTSFVRDGDGEFVEGPPDPGDPGVPCFTKGTLIATEQGDMAVEDLRSGMRVMSLDRGLVTLRAIRAATISASVLRWNPDLCPITVPAGTVGNTRPLTVSPAHRLLVQGPDIELICGEVEAFVPAHHFQSLPGVTRVPPNRSVTYYHLLFDRHEVICSDGIWTESLYLGDVAHAAIRVAQDWDVAAGFDLAAAAHGAIARPVLKGFEARVLLQQGLLNGQSVAQAA